MLKQLLRRWLTIEDPPPQIIVKKVYMNPLSKERLQWLGTRLKVLEPMVNTLKLYVNSSAAGVANTSVGMALSQAQTELLLIQTEMSVLTDFFQRQQEEPKQVIK